MNEKDRPAGAWRKYTPCGCVFLMVLVGVGLPAIGWIVWSANAARLVETELAKIREASQPLEPADLDEFYSLPVGRADATKLWVELGITFDSASFGRDVAGIPIVGDGPEIPPVGEEWEQLEAVEELLERYKGEMAKIHEAVRLGGYARFDRSFEDGFEMLLPNVQQLRASARMLQLEARVAAHRGDSDAVARAIHGIFAASRALEEDPIFVCYLVRLALIGMAKSELESALGEVEFSDADLEMLRNDVSSIDFRRGMERSLMGERVMGIVAFRDPGRFGVGQGMPLPMRPNNEDLALYLSTFSRYIEASRQPFPQALIVAEQAEQEVTEAVTGSRLNNLRYVYTSMILPAINGVFEATGRAAGSVSAVDTAIATEQYRRQHGTLPTTLAELVPDFLDVVPIDPMDGQPLRYIVNDDGYLLYSVGRNRVDDGGVMGDERLDEVFSVKIRPVKEPAKDNE